MDLHLLLSSIMVVLLLVIVIELAVHDVHLMSLPELLGRLSTKNLLISRHFAVVVLQVFI